MPTHSDRRAVPYSAEQMFDLVAGIEKYPEFLPWCTAARIRRRTDNLIVADLAIGFKAVREKFTSKVELSPPHRIDVTYAEGPFKYLNNRWIFEPQPDGSCIIDFFVDFEFRSILLQKIIGLLFNEAVKRMVRAFEQRAHDLYGDNAASAHSEIGHDKHDPSVA